MASKVDKTTAESDSVSILPERIHFKQFVSMHPELDEMQIAGFKSFCGTKEWMREGEWSHNLETYNKRK